MQANRFCSMAHRLNDTIPLVYSEKNLYSSLRKTKAMVSGRPKGFSPMIVNHNSISAINLFVITIRRSMNPEEVYRGFCTRDRAATGKCCSLPTQDSLHRTCHTPHQPTPPQPFRHAQGTKRRHEGRYSHQQRSMAPDVAHHRPSPVHHRQSVRARVPRPATAPPAGSPPLPPRLSGVRPIRSASRS